MESKVITTAQMKTMNTEQLREVAFDKTQPTGVRKRALRSRWTLLDAGRDNSEGCTWRNGEIVAVR